MEDNSTTISVIGNSSEKVVSCDVFIEQNHSQFDFTNGMFDGILYNLIINIFVSAVVIVIFTLLRKKGFQYGRIALINRMEESKRWISIFFGGQEITPDDPDLMCESTDSLDMCSLYQDNKFYSWISLIFKVKLQDIREKIGTEAYQYLKFQQYLIIYTFIVMVSSIVVILPINNTGKNIVNDTVFGQTITSNLDPSSTLLWCHAVLAEVLVIPLFIIRAIYAKNYLEPDVPKSRTLMIHGIPARQSNRNYILRFFRDRYPDFSVTEVEIAYNISKLMKLDQKRKEAEDALRVCKEIFDKDGFRPDMTRFPCGKCCCLFQSCLCPKVDAIQHYEHQATEYGEKCEKEKELVERSPVGIAFVTFDRKYSAQRFVCALNYYHGYLKYGCGFRCLSLGEDLDTFVWNVGFAPSPENIYWENLSVNRWKWWMKAVFVNVISLGALFFVTTPLLIVHKLHESGAIRAVKSDKKWLVDFLLTLLMWSLSAFMPNIVYFLDTKLMNYWTRTTENYVVMVKTFAFLVFMVLLLPSLGFTSAVNLWISTETDLSLQWSCVFLPGHCAFFVKYVITAALTGSALELLRFSELFMYCLKMLLARSAAEKSAIRKMAVNEFHYSLNYAWMMCIFAVIISYSFLSPMVVPCGLAYIILKHGVDRYNIYFAYRPSKTYKKIHYSSVSFMILAIMLLQLNLVYFVSSTPNINKSLNSFIRWCMIVNLTLAFQIHEHFWSYFLECLRKVKCLRTLTDEEERLHSQPASIQKRYVADVLLDYDLQQESSSRCQAPCYGTIDRGATDMI